MPPLRYLAGSPRPCDNRNLESLKTLAPRPLRAIRDPATLETNLKIADDKSRRCNAVTLRHAEADTHTKVKLLSVSDTLSHPLPHKDPPFPTESVPLLCYLPVLQFAVLPTAPYYAVLPYNCMRDPSSHSCNRPRVPRITFSPSPPPRGPLCI